MSAETNGGRPGPSRFTVVRDGLSFLGGWYLIIYQAQFAPVFNLTVFLGGMVIAGVPGAVQAWQARPGGSRYYGWIVIGLSAGSVVGGAAAVVVRGLWG